MSVRFWLLLGVALGLLVVYPALGTAVAALLGTAAVTVASQPLVWAFAAGVLARPRLTRTFRSTP